MDFLAAHAMLFYSLDYPNETNLFKLIKNEYVMYFRRLKQCHLSYDTTFKYSYIILEVG